MAINPANVVHGQSNVYLIVGRIEAIIDTYFASILHDHDRVSSVGNNFKLDALARNAGLSPSQVHDERVIDELRRRFTQAQWHFSTNSSMVGGRFQIESIDLFWVPFVPVQEDRCVSMFLG